MMTFDVLVTRIDGLDSDDLLRWIVNKWVRPESQSGHYVFEEIDVARVHLIHELREDMDVNEAALPVVLSLLDQLYGLRRQVRAIGDAIDEIASEDMRRALAAHVAGHRLAVLLGPSGFVAVIAGWVTTEVGRQPYTIYGLLRTSDAVSPLAAPAVGVSLLAFVIVYFSVFAAGGWYILKLMAKPPQAHESAEPVEHGPIRSAGITPAPAIEGGRP